MVLAARLHKTIVLPYPIECGSEGQNLRYLPDCVSGDICLPFLLEGWMQRHALVNEIPDDSGKRLID
jgi:hypothetical protein